MDRAENRHKRVRTLVAKAGGLARFAEMVSISAAQAWQIASEEPRRGIGSKMAERIEKAFNLPAGWLDWTDDAPSLRPAPMAASQTGGTWIPVLNQAAVAAWGSGAKSASKGDEISALFSDIPLSPASFAIEIWDQSMSPQFLVGDRVIVDAQRMPSPGSYVVVMEGNGKVLFRKYRLRHMDAEGEHVFETVPLNDDFPISRSDQQALRILGTAVEHRRYFS